MFVLRLIHTCAENPLLFSIKRRGAWSITDTHSPGSKHLPQPFVLLKKTTMQLQYFVPLCFLLALGLLGQRSEGRTVILDKCVVNIHMHELQKYYSTIRTSATAGDTAIEVKLLNNGLLTKVQEGQTCCFVRLLLRFFVERVFVSFTPSEAEEQRATSALANGFISIRGNIHKCHCHCDEGTQRIMDSIITEFDKLQVGAAAKKAVGELDTVLGWLETHSQKAQTRK